MNILGLGSKKNLRGVKRKEKSVCVSSRTTERQDTCSDSMWQGLRSGGNTREPLQSGTESTTMHGKNDHLMIMRMSMTGVSLVVIAVIAIITVTEAI